MEPFDLEKLNQALKQLDEMAANAKTPKERETLEAVARRTRQKAFGGMTDDQILEQEQRPRMGFGDLHVLESQRQKKEAASPTGENNEPEPPTEFKTTKISPYELFSGQLKTAQDYRRAMDLYDALAGSTEQIAEAISTGGAPLGYKGAKIDSSKQRQALKSMADKGVSDLASRYALYKQATAEEEKQPSSDPADEESALYRQLYEEATGKKLPSTVPASVIAKSLPLLTKISQRRADAEQLALKKESERKKEERYLNKDVRQLTEDLKPEEDSLLAFSEVENILKDEFDQEDFSFDDFDKAAFEKSGKDVPGKSIWGLGRWYFLTSAGRSFKTKVQGVLNKAIAAFAGKAVTKNELERINTQFAQDRFNTESELVDALAQAKRAIRAGIESTKAGGSEEAVMELERRRAKRKSQSSVPTPAPAKSSDSDDIEEYPLG